MINKAITSKRFIPVMKSLPKLFIASVYLLTANAFADINSEEAEEIVRTFDCNGNSIDEILKHTIKKHSQRDLGWRTFTEEGYIDVERAILVNKGKQIRYRWRVDAHGGVTAVSKKAKKICSN